MDADNLSELAEACIEIHAMIERGGTPAMREAARLLLFAVGRELARRTIDGDDPTADE